MSNYPLLHTKNDKNDLIKKYYIALLPLIIFSFYKNGLLLYNTNLIPFTKCFLLFYFYGISILIGFIIAILFKENKKENILFCLILSCSISINTNMLIYPIILFIALFISKYLLEKTKLTFNYLSFTRLLLILSLLINSYSYMNIGEKLHKFNYNLFDYFLGHGVGGLATTSMLILIISLIILCTNKFYKKIIPISSSIVYLSFGLIYILITHNYSYFETILNGTVYFSFIFVGADLYLTPSHKKGMLIYGLTLGFIASIISLWNIYEAGYISIFITSLFIPFINKIINHEYLKRLQ